MGFLTQMKDFLLTLVTSEVFWAAIGALAAIVGIIIAWRHWSSSRESQQLPTPRVAALKDEQDSVQCQVEAILKARTAVSLGLHTLHTSETNWKAKRINSALAEAQKRGLTVRILTSWGPQQVAGAYEIAEQLGVQVRLVPELQHSDLRFLKVDADMLVLGLADVEKTDAQYIPSHSWGQIRSHVLGQIIERELQRLWLTPSSQTFQQFCVDYISSQLQLVPATRLSEDLNVPVQFVNRFRQTKTFRRVMGPYVLVFHGKANSGKSTLIDQLSRHFAAKSLDLIHFVLPYVFRYGNEEVVDDQVKAMYHEMLGHCEGQQYDIIETGSDYPDYVLPTVFRTIVKYQFKPVVVYCQLPYDEALQRNERRTRPVPISVLSNQEKEEQSGKLDPICKDHGVPLIRVDTASSTAAVFNGLLAELMKLPDISLAVD